MDPPNLAVCVAIAAMTRLLEWPKELGRAIFSRRELFEYNMG